MHELSIAVSLVDLACDEARRLNLPRVQAVHIQLGALSGVVEHALHFSFDLAASGTLIENARLEVHVVPATVWCPICQLDRTLHDVQRRRCPVCNAQTPHLITGDELELVSLEVAEDAGQDCRGTSEYPA